MFKMTPNILRNLVFKKSTRRYPLHVREPFKGVRGELVNDMQKCNICGICSAKCPSQCIAADKKASTWSCDPFACIYCGVCVDACPAKSLSQKSRYRRPVHRREIISLEGRPRNKAAASVSAEIESQRGMK